MRLLFDPEVKQDLGRFFVSFFDVRLHLQENLNVCLNMTLYSSNDEITAVRNEFGLDERRVKEALKSLRSWLSMQSHLPQNVDDGRLERWLIRCKNSMEKTKTSLDMYYTLKNVVPDILCNRDPTATWFMDISNEVRMCEDYCSGDVYIMDFKNFTLGHVTKITIPFLKKMEVCAMKGFNMRIKEIHLLNLPSYAEVLVTLIKSVLKPKLAERIKVHNKGYSSLHEKVSPKILPSEYGGEAGPIMEHWCKRYNIKYPISKMLPGSENLRATGIGSWNKTNTNQTNPNVLENQLPAVTYLVSKDRFEN
ncbi:hypothetical protein C0J52_01303 [Blattella germanica]|nr:hypothetical protein C0J52_01303 [Blattella germanica]